MLTRFSFREGVDRAWSERNTHLEDYIRVFKDDAYPNGTGSCLIFTYRVKEETFTHR
jgi:hypothetical protein